ncbi:SDR family NAD(P)-dependent oxidoreductase [Acuticoccus sp. I52.16.1]|uniref:SDR family NAD(P)-dependent oxidoreductase n=1 Tax=Acuticoccus sp. I52.16.1 TaxID=2928472 RepID=UPI001FD2E5EF|nr:SDR family oxidoreductase [Acuticoccus sp. I52.16.1]UOM35748.1 SDR family oxidoreductase [Acuticoccus sp. I52.16.1]
MSVLDRFRLDGKRALVTGASRGLGREMALALASAGADIVLVARPSADLDSTAEDIRAEGRAVTVLPGDAGVPETAATICEAALTEAGAIDILINNVGGRRENITLQDTSLDTWRTLVDLNLTAAVACTKVIGAAMIERGTGGRIINVASINAFVAGRGISGRHYETAKAGLVQFTRAIAVDWAPHQITANAICPGMFMTAPNQRWARERPEIIEAAVAGIPAGHAGDPEDLGPLAVYLASDASRYMTGAALTIDGGFTCL